MIGKCIGGGNGMEGWAMALGRYELKNKKGSSQEMAEFAHSLNLSIPFLRDHKGNIKKCQSQKGQSNQNLKNANKTVFDF